MKDIWKVKDIPSDFNFTNLTQDKRDIHLLYENAREFDSFFFNADMSEIYGITGIIPLNERPVFRVL